MGERRDGVADATFHWPFDWLARGLAGGTRKNDPAADGKGEGDGGKKGKGMR